MTRSISDHKKHSFREYTDKDSSLQVTCATNIIQVTPTISTSPAYASGDQIGGIMTIPLAVRQDELKGYGTSELVEVSIIDASKQDAAIDIWFFNKSPTVTSVDNGAFAMTYANAQAQWVGTVKIGTSGTYSDASAISTCSAANLNIPFKILGTESAPTSLFAIAISRGTPTYATTTALTFQFKFFLD